MNFIQEDLITESSDSQKSSLDEWGSCGKIFFILRYLVERYVNKIFAVVFS